MEIQLKKGLLDALVLALVKKNDVYGYQLFSDVSEVMEVSESTLYPILRRLEAQDLLETYTLEHSGRLRKYYRLTREGVLKLEEYKKQCIDLKKIVEVIFGKEV